MGVPDQTPLLQLGRGDRSGGAGAQPVDLGKRVRELRKNYGWTLAEAASQVGLARSTLSKIENGLMSPTLDALKKLAIGLRVTIPQLFKVAGVPDAHGRLALTPAGSGHAYPTATYEHELLAFGRTDKKMLPYRARIRARRFEDFDGWVRHEGEEFMLVLTGVVRLYSEFYEPADLRRGDCAYYDATMGHNVISLSEEDATVLWVTSSEND